MSKRVEGLVMAPLPYPKATRQTNNRPPTRIAPRVRSAVDYSSVLPPPQLVDRAGYAMMEATMAKCWSMITMFRVLHNFCEYSPNYHCCGTGRLSRRSLTSFGCPRRLCHPCCLLGLSIWLIIIPFYHVLDCLSSAKEYYFSDDFWLVNCASEY